MKCECGYRFFPWRKYHKFRTYRNEWGKECPKCGRCYVGRDEVIITAEIEDDNPFIRQHRQQQRRRK